MEHRKVAKSEKQYLRGIIHNLSLQKWTDQDIVDYLRDEKSIDIGRSTVTKIKNQIEKEAEKWYIELKKSTYKFVAIYKERIDSLFSYQKKLYEIINDTDKPEVKLRATSELHSIEMSIFSLWKQLPDLDIVDSPQQEESLNKDKSPYINIDTVMPEDRDRIFPIAICRCEGNQQHYACYKCLKAFCRPEAENDKDCIRCPGCKTVVFEHTGWY
jgi:DNA-directed RNA polymerase subunit RPC12/RpoP